MQPVICIPGFLGEAIDFAWLSKPTLFVDLFGDENFLGDFQHISSSITQQSSLSYPADAIGYSLGGRLLLHAVATHPQKFRKIVIISAHTGLNDNAERQLRLEADRQWVTKFKNNFSATLALWNQQPVFNGHVLIRSPLHASITAVEHALTEWSLGAMPDLLPLLADIQVPILWIVGEEDRKFTAVAHNASNILKNIHLTVLPQCGHRLMWQAPRQVRTLVEEFLKG